MENQAELADKLISIACSEEFWKRLHEGEMRLLKKLEKSQK